MQQQNSFLIKLCLSLFFLPTASRSCLWLNVLPESESI